MGEVVEGDVAAAEEGFEEVLVDGDIDNADDGGQRQEFDGFAGAE